MPDELKIVSEDVQEKFGLVIEGINMMNERMDRHEKGEKRGLAGLKPKSWR
jgi:hypothetical protein